MKSMSSLGLALALAVSAGIAFAADPASAKKAPAMDAMRLTPAADVKWTPIDPQQGDKGPQMSVVFGDPAVKAPIGLFLKIPAGVSPGAHIHSSDYYAVEVFGTEHNYASASADKGAKLPPGSWWFQKGGAGHNNYCEPGADCVLFVYMPNGFDMSPDPSVKPAKQ